MYRLLILGVIASLTAAQLDPQMLMMMNLMGNSGSSTSGSAGGSTSNSMESMILCRNTPDLRMVPCGQWKEVCNMISMQKYQLPNAMTCSALGIGCCIKDMATLMLLQNSA